MRDEKAVITHHEAGHAVAALMTVVGDLDGRVSATIIGGRGTGYAEIVHWFTREPVQAAFVFYAGPWAEARVQWQQPALEGLDDTDANGRSFRETVTTAFKDAVHFGGTSDLALYTEMTTIDSSVPEREPCWSRELERAWPVIETLAKELRDRLDVAEPMPCPLRGVPATEHRTMISAEMAAADVVALVQPRLEERGIWRYIT